jgi:hypothetical protein
VVDQERPVEVKKFELVVEKKLFTFFQASVLVVLNERPTEVKYAADVVEKKLLAALYASADVVAHARPTEEKYVADDVENEFARYELPSRPSKSPLQLPVVSR